MDPRDVKSKHAVFNHRRARGASPHEGFIYSPYHDQGPSNYYINSYYELGETPRYQDNGFDAHARVDSLENTRVELLRKLNELENELSRSCEVTEKSKGRIGVGKTIDSSEYPRDHARHRVRDGLIYSNGVNKLPRAPDDIKKAFSGETYGHGLSLMEPYSGSRYSHEFQGYVSNCQPEMFETHPHRTRSRYISRLHHQHTHDSYVDVNRNHFISHPSEHFSHQPLCSCIHCCNNNLNLAPKIQSSGLYNRRRENEPSNPHSRRPSNPIGHRVHGCSSGSSNARLHSQLSSTPYRCDMNSENYAFNDVQSEKSTVPYKRRHMLHPVAGGAPFITCGKCYELLRLPRKKFLFAEKQQKMKCGACSSLILFKLGNEGFDEPVSAHVHQIPTETEGSSLIANGDSEPTADWNTCNTDFDDSLSKSSPTGRKSDSGVSEKQLDPPPSISRPETLMSEDHDSPTITEAEPFLLLPSSLSGEFPKHSSDNILADSQPDKGSTSKRSELEFPNHSADNILADQPDEGSTSKRSETIVSTNSSSRRDSVEVPASATEMDLSWNEITNVSHDTSEITKGEECRSPDVQKRSNQNIEVGGLYVFVNGHLIPDFAVKNAEKLAGPIQPGEYWYDRRAGFWGVMGHPCLGIVMPNIEEFNYPMPVGCGGGNTGVFVNGRELHNKDLELLVSRGLPSTSQRSYLVEISGAVIDAQTGEGLLNLGKLAPTVERSNQGFGMKVPRFITELKSSC